ncbi:MAG: hypothetical protein K6A30_00445 [Lachnospiraceae bacterium]|nr:hypothetical protein [Lachnospiraceae bacterium]
MMKAKNKLFPYLGKIPKGFESMLFCFHHAGGSASAYYPFIAKEEDVAVIPVELPGHGARREEDQMVEWRTLIGPIASQIQLLVEAYDKPVRLMGCSLGSLIAFEVAAELEKRGIQVEQLVICSHCSPDVESPGYKTSMGKKALKKELETLSGTDDAIMQDEEMLEFFLPVIYYDYKLHDNYKYDGKVLDNINLKVVAGSEDPYFNYSNMKNWKYMTTGEYEFQEFEGGHFFPYETGYFDKVISEDEQHEIKVLQHNRA